MSTTQLEAEVDRITFRNDDNGWTVSKMRCQSDGAVITVTGSFPVINPGQSFQLFGYWTKHPHYGEQFRADRVVPTRPTSPKAILKFLSSGLIEGIGPKTAEKIVKHFGGRTLDILDNDINQLLKVPSIGRKKLGAVIESWNKNKAVHDVMIFLNTYGI